MSSGDYNLMPHQAAGVARNAGLSTLGLFWEMRCGKTRVAILWGEDSMKPGDHALVACPKEVIPSWMNEFAELGIDAVELRGSVDDRLQTIADNRHERWFVTNYEGLIRVRRGRQAQASEIARLPWRLALLDESTRIRSPKAATTKVALAYLAQSPLRGILTGLPNPESTFDFVTQMLFLRGGSFMGCRSFWEWRAKYAQPAGHDWHLKHKHRGELRRQVESSCHFLTRREAGIGNKKIYETRHVHLPRKIVAAMRRAEAEWQIGDKLAMNKLQILGWLGQLAGGRYMHDDGLHHDVKVREVAELATGELKREPCVVWCRYTAEIHAVAAALKKAGQTVRVAGGFMQPGENVANSRDFQKGKFRWYVCQTRSFQYGKDLSRASTEVYYSNYFDREIRSQSEDRIEHPKKNEPLLVVDLVAKDPSGKTKTMDEVVVEALKDKKIDAAGFRLRIFKELAARKDAE